ncbi:helix-turn-helix transcriptional regulator [Flavobacterium subsaxonicum]|uniref:Plasmid maintenance system antidote protein n=1 Tax=Flavobacterium subsaxonicum WB 4.1-42 = DSM 21790 TaxID=1121898 RepID=A0A0A2MQI2_9FLAO|nr:transcriptional regulator [Flavobacterium subsaxonicum]KGO93683.1 plasmid maintenance system antidote protein [Flavobacterium subsaxonicum WB 4.1-42 = DSM 21790]
MDMQFHKYKGIHPGAIVARELKKRALAQRPFALTIGIAPQSFNQIIKAKRPLPLSAALKIEKALSLEEGALAVLQTYYDIEIQKLKDATITKPNITRLRKSLFWDTDIDTIDWEKKSKAVIERIFERGNITEKKEIIRFYGTPKVRSIISNPSTKAKFTRSHKP